MHAFTFQKNQNDIILQYNKIQKTNYKPLFDYKKKALNS